MIRLGKRTLLLFLCERTSISLPSVLNWPCNLHWPIECNKVILWDFQMLASRGLEASALIIFLSSMTCEEDINKLSRGLWSPFILLFWRKGAAPGFSLVLHAYHNSSHFTHREAMLRFFSGQKCWIPALHSGFEKITTEKACRLTGHFGRWHQACKIVNTEWHLSCPLGAQMHSHA